MKKVSDPKEALILLCENTQQGKISPIIFTYTTPEEMPFLVNRGHMMSRKEAQCLAVICEYHIRSYTDEQIRIFNELSEKEDVPDTTPKQISYGFVYLCRNNRNGLIKIGHSSSPKYRERTLQSEEPDVEMIWFGVGTIGQEKALHKKYDSLRKRGEWFDLCPTDVEDIKKAHNS